MEQTKSLNSKANRKLFQTWKLSLNLDDLADDNPNQSDEAFVRDSYDWNLMSDGLAFAQDKASSTK